MKNFDMTRFGRVLKLDFAEGLKTMMWGALCMLLLYLFFFWFAHNIGFHRSQFYYAESETDLQYARMKAIAESVGVFSLMAMYIFFLLAASTLYRGEQKKQQRIAWLMLPASNLEKFLSRWLYLVAWSVVGGILSFLVADAIHCAWLWMSGQPVIAAAGYFFEYWPHPAENLYHDSWSHVITVYSLLTAIHAFFLLGGVLFKRFHFIATGAVVVLLFALWATLYNSLMLYKSTPTTGDYNADSIVMAVFFFSVGALLTWLSYWLFCRWQVVTHKFANL